MRHFKIIAIKTASAKFNIDCQKQYSQISTL